MITVLPRFLEHKSGSKYHEVITFEHLGRKVLVKRYGPISQFRKPGAGQEPSLEVLPESAIFQQAADKFVAQKTTAAKGYKRITISHGFHDAMDDIAYSMTPSEFVTVAKEHYGPQLIERLKVELDINGIGPEMQKPGKKKQESRDRGAGWGSW
ncbi:hypothetical protein ACODYM_29385 [Burkholderia gladioli]|uniref:hypothetical protein n=1 Tax=Burkholderia gladioli TaxID=28095 RepID=UPI003B502B44